MAKSYNTFEDFKFNRQILNAVNDAGYETPTPIQRKTIPLINGGADVIGIAQTGTGKTAAFALPILRKLNFAQGNDPRVVILGPTKELICQLFDEIKKFSTYTDLRAVVLYGGVGPKTQIEEIEKGVDIIVATPGRFMEIYLKGKLQTKSIEIMVLDEADRMMDMGFMPQIRKILEVIPRKRQNLLFSATFSSKVETLSEEFLAFPKKVEVTPQFTPAETVEQRVYELPNFKTKINMLEHLFNNEEGMDKVMIFTNSKSIADNVFKFLERKMDLEVRVVHSNKAQNSRINALKEFSESKVNVLVATDVSSRGIDVDGITHVINFEIPHAYEDYVHRIGRTGRAGKSGIAFSFVNDIEKKHLAKIEKLIRMEVPRYPLPIDLVIEQTPFVEKQMMDRELDAIKRKENPDFKGAFHEKKWKKKKK